MIPAKEFILVYNELFKFIEKKYSKENVIKLWEFISDKFLTDFDQLIKDKGILGIVEYSAHTLTEEGAEFTMSVRPYYFENFIEKCPSIKIMNKRKVKKYPQYCEHCIILYKKIIEKYGFTYKIQFIDREKGKCKIKIKKISHKREK